MSPLTFQSTPLMRGATWWTRRSRCSSGNFNPRPSYEGRLCTWWIASITLSFQSTPLIRGATYVCRCSTPKYEFQSTPLIRGATHPVAVLGADCQFQSTPLIRGATRRFLPQVGQQEISIHAPHTRGDADVVRFDDGLQISIHAPHTRGDCLLTLMPRGHQHFNPRPSYEGRR